MLFLFVILSTLIGCREKFVQKYPNGNTKQIFHTIMLTDILDGSSKGYYKNGKLKYEQHYRFNKVVGVHKIYYPNGIIKQIQIIKDGKINGFDSLFHDNGQIKRVFISKDNNIIDQKCIRWHNNGRKEFECQYKNGKLNGDFTWFDSSGNIQEKGIYINGSIEGNKIVYNTNGKKYMEMLYKNGKRKGLFKMFHSNGKVATTGYMYGDKFLYGTQCLYDSMGIYLGKRVYNINFDTIQDIRNIGNVNGMMYKYNKQGKIIDKKSFVMNYDSIYNYDMPTAIKYVRKHTRFPDK